VRKVGV